MLSFPVAFWKSAGATTYVNSIQHVQIGITVGNTSQTATISAVGSRAFILFNGFSCTTANNPSISMPRVELTNSTTITAYRNTSDAAITTVVNVVVVDATAALVTSVQAGTISIASALSNTATVSAVNNSYTAIHNLGQTTPATSANGIKDYQTTLSLASTTVTAAKQTSTVDCVVGYQVIEFNSSALNQAVQNVSKTWTTGTSTTSTITSVDTSKSMIIWGGNSANVTATHSTAEQYAQLTNSTTVTVAVNTSNAASKTYNCTVVEFKPAVMKSSVQRNTTALATVSSNTATITSVTTSKAAVNNLRAISTLGSLAIRDSYCRTELTDATTVTTTRGTANGTLTNSWEVIEFN